MTHVLRRCSWVVGLATSMICAPACGGGSGSSHPSPPPPGTGPNYDLRVRSGDKQVAMAGTSLPEPVWLKVTFHGEPILNHQISFTADTGVKVVPNPATTGPEGETRVLVYLPDVTNSNFNIVAKPQTGDSKTITARSGPRMLAMLGKPAPPASAQVLDDGTLVLGSVTGTNAVPGVWVLAPDGSVRANSSPASRRSVVPNGYFFPCRSRQAGRLVFHNMDSMVLITDLDLNVLNYIDLYTSTGMAPYVSSISALGPDGSMYVQGNDGIIALDPKGRPKWMLNNAAGPGYKTISDLTSSGNIVGMDTTTVYEIRPDGTLSGSFPLPDNIQSDYWRSLRVAPNGNFILAARPVAHAGIEIFVYNAKYELIDHLLPAWESGSRITVDFTLVGADAAGNYYLSIAQDFILQLDATGKVTRRIEDHDFHVGWGMVADAPRDRMFLGNYASSKHTIVNDQQISGEWTPSGLQPSVGANPITGEIYVTSVDMNFEPMRIDVYDNSFAFLRSMSLSQVITPRQIVFDSVGNKYIVDERTRSIHKLDAFDIYQGSLSLESNWRVEIAITPDDALLVHAPYKLTKMKGDGTVLWTTSLVYDAPFAIDEDGSIYLDEFGVIKKLDATGHRITDFPEYRFGGTGPLTVMNDKLYALGRDRLYIIQLR